MGGVYGFCTRADLCTGSARMLALGRCHLLDRPGRACRSQGVGRRGHEWRLRSVTGGCPNAPRRPRPMHPRHLRGKTTGQGGGAGSSPAGSVSGRLIACPSPVGVRGTYSGIGGPRCGCSRHKDGAATLDYPYLLWSYAGRLLTRTLSRAPATLPELARRRLLLPTGQSADRRQSGFLAPGRGTPPPPPPPLTPTPPPTTPPPLSRAHRRH